MSDESGRLDQNKPPPPITLSKDSKDKRREKREIYKRNERAYKGDNNSRSRMEFVCAVLRVENTTDYIVDGFFSNRISYENALKSYDWMRENAPELAWEVYREIHRQNSDSLDSSDFPSMTESSPQYIFEHVGSKADAINQIRQRTQDILQIWNTHIVSQDDVKYSPEETESFYQLFSEIMSQNGSIIDVVGGDLRDRLKRLGFGR